jgi:phospho-N-acetylmuramoyl-pentapeptide-transferase
MVSQAEILTLVSCFVFSFLVLIMLGNFIIPALEVVFYNKNNDNVANTESRTALEHHEHKIGTLPIGGVLIIISSLAAFYLFGDMSNIIGIVIIALLSNAIIGCIDDYTKGSNNNMGLKAGIKFLFQLVVYLILLYLIHYMYVEGEKQEFTKIFVPFFAINISLGMVYYLFAVFVVLGCSNAVNLTDGLDGLAAFPLILNYLFAGVLFFLVSSNIAGDEFSFSEIMDPKTQTKSTMMTAYDYYLLALLCFSVAGSVLGFLWYNSNPAIIFMGDNGSLSLGALLGFLYIILKKEILLVFAGLPFVIETLSVILQVGYFKLTGGERLFQMTPIHHHYEKLGFKEVTIVTRFWIFAVISIAVAIIIYITEY